MATAIRTASFDDLLLADNGQITATHRTAAASGGVSTQAVGGSSSNGTLSVTGDNLDNSVAVSRNAAGQILVNGGAVDIAGTTPTVANTSLIQAFGLGGNDVITLSETNGALPRANLFGGAGNDVLTGGSGGDMLFGQADNDTLLGKGGADFLFGGEGNDVLTGGDGDDQMFGESGDDRFIWNPGDDTDLAEGGAGIDTLEVNGGNGAETFTIVPNGTRVRFDRVNPAPFSVDAGTIEQIVVNANGGDDVITASNGLAALVQLTIDGGAGNDTIISGDGADLLLGGDGNDSITGGRGNDTALMGAGNDGFAWNPGDGSDTVEGQDGSDTLVFNGSNASETLDISANGSRTRLTRNVAAIVMDLNDVETIALQTLGGADIINVNDLSGTDVTTVNIGLTPVGGVADQQIDRVTVAGTNGEDVVEVFGAGGSLAVVGLHAMVNVSGSEGQDQLQISTLGGNDIIVATTVTATTAALSIDAGAGDDIVLGSQGADVIFGGDGNDIVDGNQGNDVAFLGAGNDRFMWNPGEGSDTVEGQDGTDTLQFGGSAASENISLSANGARARLFRDVANITMDLNQVERVEINALNGADTVNVGDMSGTGVNQVAINLGNADGAADTVNLSASNGAESLVVQTVGSGHQVSGAAAEVRVSGAEATDTLRINAGGGNDVVDASSFSANAMRLEINGGLGDDVIIGSSGSDTVTGGDGNDLALLSDGNDTFTWNPGDDNDTVEGQGGSDTLRLNGSNVGETIAISANGGRVRLTRDVAAVTMDLNDMERVDIRTLGGADNITIGDLSGTDVTQVNLELASTVGGVAGDGQADSVRVEGTSGSDIIQVAGTASFRTVTGLSAEVTLAHGDALLDGLVIASGAGNDTLDARNLAGDTRLHFQGGAGNDTLQVGSGDVEYRFSDFQAGVGVSDRIDLRGLTGTVDFQWLLSHAQNVSGSTLIDLGNGGHLQLDGVSVAGLSADDFVFDAVLQPTAVEPGSSFVGSA
ncbi:MAG: calcium-binding protein [Rhizobacter sp.]|nr:calcium-binding protein [Rhizobacter sp.]